MKCGITKVGLCKSFFMVVMNDKWVFVASCIILTKALALEFQSVLCTSLGRVYDSTNLLSSSIMPLHCCTQCLRCEKNCALFVWAGLRSIILN